MQVITGFHRMYISHITLCISEIINREQKSNLASNCNHAHECCGKLWASVGVYCIVNVIMLFIHKLFQIPKLLKKIQLCNGILRFCI